MKAYILTLIALLSLSGTVQGANIMFQWNTHTEEIDGYRLYQSAVSGQYEFGRGYQEATIHPALTYFTFANVDPGTYYFVLTAYNENGESLPSNEVAATIPDLPPDPPQQGQPPSAPEGFRLTIQ